MTATDIKFSQLKEISQKLNQEGPELDIVSTAASHFLTLCKSLTAVYPFTFAPMRGYLNEVKEELTKQIEEFCQSSNQTGGIREIPRVAPEIFNQQELDELLKNPVPVVFEGAARDTEAYHTWSPQFFLDNYGDFPCQIATEDQKDIPGKLADVLKDIVEKRPRRNYVHNMANIFNEHPILEEQLELSRFLSELGSGRHIGTQLFIGGSGTGTNFHCAAIFNIFFNICGEKEWFFVHPKFGFFMDGFLHETSSYGYSPIDHNKTASQQAENFPLYKFIPVYRTTLKPGDILINPSWWWHAVNNLSDATIACATRFHLPTHRYEIYQEDPPFTIAQGLMPHAETVRKLLMKPDARITDEVFRNTFDASLGKRVNPK
ncbi:MAG: cupin-like domain-containing protein [Crocosphaera sp.]|nr:cupin-like domain-containing protein [Crocosphaera sp.]